jgi:hypothetical protein
VDAQLVGDGFGYFTLGRKNVSQFAIKAIGPEMESVTALINRRDFEEWKNLRRDLDQQPGYYDIGHCDAVNTTLF